MRYFLPLLLIVSLSTQPAHAIIMTPTTLETPHGTIRWEDLINLPAKMQMMRNAYIASTALLVGFIVYYKWQEAKKAQQQAAQVNSGEQK